MEVIRDSNGLPLKNGYCKIFNGNSSRLAVTYTDKETNVQHMNPICANSKGELPDIFLKPGIYHIKIYNDKNKLIYPKWPFTYRKTSFEIK